MRTIKFRGKDNQGEWHYGYLVIRLGITYIFEEIWEYYRGSHVKTDKFKEIKVSADTVGQFTGLYDKHDDEIYDGDFILSDKDNKVYYVTFKNGMFYASCHECNPNLHGGYSLWMVVNMGCSIIGNIHDNPELLKGGENE